MRKNRNVIKNVNCDKMFDLIAYINVHIPIL